MVLAFLGSVQYVSVASYSFVIYDPVAGDTNSISGVLWVNNVIVFVWLEIFVACRTWYTARLQLVILVARRS